MAIRTLFFYCERKITVTENGISENMARYMVLGFGFCFLVVFSGCVIVYPHMRQVAPVYTGRLLDAATHQPLKDVPICIRGLPDTERKSAQYGTFRIGPAHKFKWGILFTPPLIHDLPGPCMEWYRNIEICDHRYEMIPSQSATQPNKLPDKDGAINLGNIYLIREEKKRLGSNPQ
jgi:hypothetical protein